MNETPTFFSKMLCTTLKFTYKEYDYRRQRRTTKIVLLHVGHPIDHQRDIAGKCVYIQKKGKN